MEPETSQISSPRAPDIFFSVTPLSKFLAMLLFVVLPFAGGWVGYHYAPERIVEVETVVVRDISDQATAPYVKNTSGGTYHFSWTDESVQLLDAVSGDLLQSIMLSDIVINNPKSSFIEIYGSPELMERFQIETPQLITDMDINFDGYLDLGVLVDTGPVEGGYVFYLYNDQVKRLFPAVLRQDQKRSFVVYRPVLNQVERVLKGSLNVANPPRRDTYTYIYDAQLNVFDEKVGHLNYILSM